MFYYLNGTLEYRTYNTCVIDCGGVGYKLTISLLTSEALSAKIGEKVKIFTHLAVREDGIELFGFGSNEECEWFNRLTTVSGVGPKAAISILSTLSPERLSVAICTEDVKSISKASGIGAKTAARIVLELKDKVSKEMIGSSSTTLASPSAGASSGDQAMPSTALSDATEALLALGYDRNTVLSALRGIDTQKTEAGEIIKIVLKKLSSR